MTIYELALRVAHAYVERSPRWYVAAKPFFRAVRFAANVLPEVVRRPDFPVYLKTNVLAVADTLDALVSAWKTEVDLFNNSGLLCSRCGAPRQKLGPGPCERCPAPVNDSVG